MTARQITTTDDGFSLGHVLYGASSTGTVEVSVIVCDTCGSVVLKCDKHREQCPAPMRAGA